MWVGMGKVSAFHFYLAEAHGAMGEGEMGCRRSEHAPVFPCGRGMARDYRPPCTDDLRI